MKVTRPMLIDQLVERNHYTKKAATQLVDDFIDIVLYNMERGNSVSLWQFGSFEVVEHKPHNTRLPGANDLMEIPGHWTPKFRPFNGMRIAVKIWEDNQRRGLG